MFEKEDLIPGFENYMEDASVEVSVEVGDEPEQVAEVEENTEAAVEVEENVQEQEADADQAEMISRSFDQLEDMRYFVQEHGVDRTFLFFHAPKLEAMNITVPSMESFDTIGDPNSAISIAAMEGLGSALGKVWEWIKTIATKIKNFIMKIWESLRVRFGNINKNIGRLREALADRVDDADKLKKAGTKATVSDMAQVEAALKECLTFKQTLFKFKFSETITKIITDFSGRVIAASQVSSSISGSVSEKRQVNPRAMMTQANNTLVQSIMGLDGNLRQVEATGAKVKDIKSRAKKVPLARIPWGQLGTYLDNAASIRRHIEECESEIKGVRQCADRLAELAQKAEQRKDEGAEGLGRLARRIATNNNRYSSAVAKLLNNLNWCATEYVRTAALRIATGSKKAG